MFHIVEFSATPTRKAEVAIVPASWMVDDHSCVWPPYRDVMRAVKKSEEPKSDWNVHTARVIRSFGTYAAARTRIRASEKTSDLDSSDMDLTSRKRSATKLQTSSSSDTESEADSDCLPPPPRAPRLVLVGHGLSSSEGLGSAVSGSSTSTGSSASPATSSLVSKASILSPAVCPEKTTVSQYTSPKNYAEFTPPSSKNVPRANSRPYQNQSVYGVGNFAEEHRSSSNLDASELAWSTSEIVSCMLTNFAKVKVQMRQMDAKLDCLLSKVSAASGQSVNETSVIKMVMSEQDFNAFEGELRNELFRNAVILELSSCGGGNCYETVRRIMKKLMADVVMKTFSLHGKKKKESFISTEMFKVVQAASHRNANLKLTDKEIEKAISSVFRHI